MTCWTTGPVECPLTGDWAVFCNIDSPQCKYYRKDEDGEGVEK